jgi:hypothetical protein
VNAQLKHNPDIGFFPEIPEADYHRRELGVVSNSILKILRDKTPAHYFAYITGKVEDEDTPAKRFGRLYHMASLEPRRFRACAVVAPDFGPMQSSRNRAERDAWRDSLGPDQVEVKQDELELIEEMTAVLHAHPVVAGILKNGQPEVTMRWIDDRTGLRCKARADWWRPGKFFADLKTTEDASPVAFAKSIETYRYHVGHAHYCDGARILGEPVNNYLLIAQEKSAPYAVNVLQIDAAAEARGFELRERGMDLMKTCLETNTWPAYGEGINEITLPAWAFKD